ncbi:hypothetical protein B0H13DRAFT_1886107 [Mycena leptocephala]|nr:hypothetical protein B0H13DRAFT_1886107 [Mycena leptocephala]
MCQQTKAALTQTRRSWEDDEAVMRVSGMEPSSAVICEQLVLLYTEDATPIFLWADLVHADNSICGVESLNINTRERQRLRNFVAAAFPNPTTENHVVGTESKAIEIEQVDIISLSGNRTSHATCTVWVGWRNGASLVERGLRTMQSIVTMGSPEYGKNLLDGKYRRRLGSGQSREGSGDNTESEGTTGRSPRSSQTENGQITEITGERQRWMARSYATVPGAGRARTPRS